MPDDITILIYLDGDELKVDQPDGETGMGKKVEWTKSDDIQNWTVGFFGPTPFVGNDRFFSNFGGSIKDWGRAKNLSDDPEIVNDYWVVAQDTNGKNYFLDPKITLTDVPEFFGEAYALLEAVEQELNNPFANTERLRELQNFLVAFLKTYQAGSEPPASS